MRLAASWRYRLELGPEMTLVRLLDEVGHLVSPIEVGREHLPEVRAVGGPLPSQLLEQVDQCSLCHVFDLEDPALKSEVPHDSSRLVRVRDGDARNVARQAKDDRMKSGPDEVVELAVQSLEVRVTHGVRHEERRAAAFAMLRNAALDDPIVVTLIGGHGLLTEIPGGALRDQDAPLAVGVLAGIDEAGTGSLASDTVGR